MVIAERICLCEAKTSFVVIATHGSSGLIMATGFEHEKQARCQETVISAKAMGLAVVLRPLQAETATTLLSWLGGSRFPG